MCDATRKYTVKHLNWNSSSVGKHWFRDSAYVTTAVKKSSEVLFCYVTIAVKKSCEVLYSGKDGFAHCWSCGHRKWRNTIREELFCFETVAQKIIQWFSAFSHSLLSCRLFLPDLVPSQGKPFASLVRLNCWDPR